MVPDRHMDPYFAEFLPPTAGMEARAHMHPGSEFLYVLEGELEIRHGDHQCTLEGGDAVYFDASTAHSYLCAGKKPSRAIIVTMHQAPPPLTAPLRAVNATMPPRTPPGAPVKTNGGDSQ
jgi:mannose-6-phosphate isomerase-like protein (cupin superfamily)